MITDVKKYQRHSTCRWHAAQFLVVATIVLLTIAPPASAQLVDLVITTGAPTVKPTKVEPGQDFTLSSWTVRNDGIMRSGDFHNGFYLSTDPVITAKDLYLDGNSNSGLLPRASFTWDVAKLTIPKTVKPGTYYVGVLVDRLNEVSESDETNNYVSSQLIVIGCPDLRVKTFTLEGATTLKPGDTLGHRMTAIAENIGNAAVDTFNIGFYLSSDPVITTSDRLLIGGREAILHLAAGASETVSILEVMRIPDDYPLGPAYLGVLLDEFQKRPECDESNNWFSIPVTISNKGPADLVITTPFSCDPVVCEPDDMVTLSPYTISNVGETGASGIRNGFYLSTDTVLTTSDLYLSDNGNSFIPAGGSWDWGGPTFRIAPNTAPGTYYIGVLVDMENDVPESNESNNFVSAKLIVEVKTGIESQPGELLPSSFTLGQNYPNPFNPSTEISFELPRAASVNLTVFNLLGQKVVTLIDRQMSAGAYTVDWDGIDYRGTAVTSGIYFYRMSAGEFHQSRKMVLMK